MKTAKRKPSATRASGGAVALLVATRKGAFILKSDKSRRAWKTAGPMFFGAAKSAMEAIATVGSGSDHTFVLNMQHVPTIDVTALVALESVLDRLYRSRIKVIFAGLTPGVAELLDRAGIKRQPGRLAYAPDVETAISMAIVHSARLSSPTAPPPAAA